MAQLIQHKRGRLERLSTITGSLQKGEILIVTGSSNITSSNGSAILFAATESGSVQATNRFIIGSSAPNVFPASTYGGLVNGVPYYDSGSGTLYLLGSDGNTPINLTGNISTFSASVATSFSASNASIASITGDFSSSVAQTFATQSLNLSNLSSSVSTSFSASQASQTTLSSSVATSFSSSLASQTQLSSSISGTISALSSSLTETIINTVSSSLSSSLSTIATDLEVSVVSSSISASQLLISSSISASIASTLSGSVASIASLSSSFSTSLASVNQSIAANTGIFLQTGSAYATTNNIEITGSLKVSGTIDPDNVTVGTPSSNAWQSNLNGSYFNNFNSETNVSEILRFVAGLLSSSAPDASPNTKTYSTVTDAATNTTTGTALLGRIPQTSTNTTITYLNGKGFATAGSTIFSGITPIYTQDTYQVSYTSTAAGTTVVSSSADAQLFGLGLLSNGTPTTFKVSGSFTHRFKDNGTKTDTETSSSQVVLTQTGAGTTTGVTLAKINTANSAVIPAAYQDGKFVSVLPQKIYVTGSTSTINISGYYDVTASISIASGSSAFTTPIVVTEGIFYAPLTQIATNIPVQTSLTGSTTLSYISAVSRSLSGAPYLSGSTYSISSSITNLFNPLFYNGTVGSIALSGTGLTATSGVTSVVTSGGTISTANGVWDTTNTTVRTTSTIPFETDVVRLNGLYTFGSSNITNITQTSFTPTTWTATMNGVNYNNGSSVSKVNTFNYHNAGDFGQPISSGSLAYFTRTQGADTSTALIESFTGENYRIQLADNVLAFNGTPTTTTVAYYNLTGNDLQVKPGYLVKPGGTYGYWLGDPDATKTYKYYIRKFTTSGTKTSMTLNLGKTLVNWGATTNDSVAVGILFESSKNTIYTPARIYDPSNLTDNFTATKTANTDGQNPFGANFDLYGNTGGSLSTTTYTLPLRNGDGMTLNATYTNIYVIVRYKGDPAPVTSITTTFS